MYDSSSTQRPAAEMIIYRSNIDISYKLLGVEDTKLKQHFLLTQSLFEFALCGGSPIDFQTIFFISDFKVQDGDARSYSGRAV